MNAFDRKMIVIVAALALLLAAVIAAGSLLGLAAPQLAQQAEEGAPALLSSRGPLTLTFADAMQAESVETRLSLEPAVAGQFRWSGGGRTVSFWPAQPLEPGQLYTARLQSGAQSQSGQVTRREYTWQVTARAPEVVYLSPSKNPEIWRIPAEGQAPQQLTSTGGQVFDFTVSPDGEHLVYSAINEQKGMDLWEITRDGGEPRLLLECRADWCINPAYSPDGVRLVYSRRRAELTQDAAPGVPRLWMINLKSLVTDMMYLDPNIGGYEPLWSPDGRYVAFFDGISRGVRILDLEAREDFLVESEMGMTGAWMPDGRRLVYANYEIDSEQPSAQVYVVDVQTQQVNLLLGDDKEPMDYSIPEVSPDGSLLVVGMRPFTGAPGTQLWLMRPGEQGMLEPVEAITTDPADNYSAYRWSPVGDKVVYQRLELGSSRSLPAVLVWDRQRNESILLAEDASSAQWLP